MDERDRPVRSGEDSRATGRASACVAGLAAVVLGGCGPGSCTGQGADPGVTVVVAGISPSVDTRVDAQVCVRAHCYASATTITPGSPIALFVPVPLESEEPVDAQIEVHAGAGEPLARTRLLLDPVVVEPNGPGCDPRVHQADVTLTALRALD